MEYAIARTYDHEGDWHAAIRHYTQWVTNITWIRSCRKLSSTWRWPTKAGMETNALTQFTNFVARFPSNSLAPWAQNWVADYYYNQQDYPSAENNYQKLYQKFGGSRRTALSGAVYGGQGGAGKPGGGGRRASIFRPGQRHQHPGGVGRSSVFRVGRRDFQQFQANPTNETYSSKRSTPSAD